MTFEVTDLPVKWQERWREAGFEAPSLIQSNTYPDLMEGKDVLGISPTGSGKTLAYLLPLLQRVKAGEGMQLLILAASQELAMQVTEVAADWGRDLGLKVQPLIGGANLKRQIEKLKQKPEVLVGTSGRVLELIRQKKVKSYQILITVLDEADQLLQEKMTEQVLKTIGNQGQFCFFSATGDKIDQNVQQLRPETVVIDVSQEDDSNKKAEHYYLNVPLRKRVDELRHLANIPDFKALVFINELNELGNAEEKLLYHDLPVASLASDQNKLMRQAALNRFKNGELALLLVTDVAARGLDIEDLPYVVNFDVPYTEEAFLHRSGRTARMGKEGTVITFINEASQNDYKKLLRKLGLQSKEIFVYGGQLTDTPKLPEKQEAAKKKKKRKQNRR